MAVKDQKSNVFEPDELDLLSEPLEQAVTSSREAAEMIAVAMRRFTWLSPRGDGERRGAEIAAMPLVYRRGRRHVGAGAVGVRNGMAWLSMPSYGRKG